MACLMAEYRLSEKGPHPAERSITRAWEGFSAMYGTASACPTPQDC